METLKKLLIYLDNIRYSLFFFLLILPFQISKGCGPYHLTFEGYTFLNPNIVDNNATFAPYFLKFNDLYKSPDSLEYIQQDENLQEWNERFCNLYQIKDIRNVIYKATVNDIKQLRNASNNKKARLPRRLRNNNFAHHLRDEKCSEVMEYLIYAKQCERHVTVGVGWSAPERDVVEMQKMIVRGKHAFVETESHYVRLRYAYQVIRLAHYSKAYNEVLNLINELMPKVHANPSLLDYWIMGHKAGALLRIGERVEAAYLYSLIFANCLSKRQSAYQSFSIKSNEEWDQLVLKCKSDEERAMLYTIRANHDDSRVIFEMEKIYEYDPKNENLELLLVKEIVKLEKDFLGKDFNNNKKRNKRYFKIPRKKSEKYLKQTTEFVTKCVKEKKVINLDLWRIAEGYLTFLGGDYAGADQIFTRLRNSMGSENEVMVNQLEVAQLALKIAQYNYPISTKDENEIGNIIRNNSNYWNYKDFPNYINDKLVDLYIKSGEKGKAFRLHHTLDALKMNPDMSMIEDLLRICEKENKSNLEEVLVKKDGLSTIKNDLLLLKGILFFNNGKIEAAAETFRKIPRNFRDQEPKFNPFHEHIIDCVHCPMTDTTMYDRVGIIEELLRLEYQGRAHLESGASSFYQLGNAYYNMTYYGDSWYVTDLFRSGGNWGYVNKDNRYLINESELGNIENKKMNQARKYYEKALDLAKNKELAARACFMLAKCDLNEYYVDPETEYHPYDNLIPILPERYNSYYLRFINEFSETQFYDEAIDECLFLSVY